MIKPKWVFWRAGFFPANQGFLETFQIVLIGCPANQGFLETFQIVLIGWIKAGPPNMPLLFWSCKQAIDHFDRAGFLSRLFFQPIIFLFSVWKAFNYFWLARKKPRYKAGSDWNDHVNRLHVNRLKLTILQGFLGQMYFAICKGPWFPQTRKSLLV